MSYLCDHCTPEESFGWSLNIPVPREHHIFSFHFYNSTSTPTPQGCVWAQKEKKMDKSTEAMQYAMGFLKRKASSPHTGFLQYLESCLKSLADNKAKKLKRQIIEFNLIQQ